VSRCRATITSGTYRLAVTRARSNSDVRTLAARPHERSRARALYEQGRAHHVGIFPRLEDQLCAFTSDFDRKRAGYSPDRVDALVWALSTLVVEQVPGLGLLQWYEQEAARLGLTGLLPGDAGPLQSEQAPTVRMMAPSVWTGTFYGVDGIRYAINAGELVDVKSEDAVVLSRMGFLDVPTEGKI
jgi:hypothetical protein